MSSASEEVWIIGAGMSKFGRYKDKDAVDLGSEVSQQALDDAATTISDIDVLACGNTYQAMAGVAQKIQKQIGQTGIPAYNVTNACATGATAVRTVIMAIRSGEAEAGLAVGVEQMGKAGMLAGAAKKRDKKTEYTPSGRFGGVMPIEGRVGTGLMPGVFAQAGMEYAMKHGVSREQFAKVAVKNHEHSALNPLAQYQTIFSLEEILNAETIAYPNTLQMCCPNGDGAAAVVIVSGARLRTLDAEVRKRAVKISASVLTTDPWVEGGQVQPDLNTLTRNAAEKAYETAGLGPQDLGLVELHDCFASAELIHYDNLGLCDPGAAGEFIDSGAPKRDGRTPVNVSGGLLSKGHPIGATGVANLYELVVQLRGEAGGRQLENNPKAGLAHVVGLGSSCCVHILEKAA